MTKESVLVRESGRTSSPGAGVELRLTAISKRFGAAVAVDDVDLDVAAGEFVTLLGPSGSGKTTTLRMIAGFEQPTSGRLLLGGRDISKVSPAERGIGMVFQNYALFPHLNVRQNIEYGLRIRKYPRTDMQQRVREMLELVQLDGFADRLPGQLSGGQQQRVALARAIAFGPGLLLMDEPLGALDRELRLQMETELQRIHRELGTTIVYVTHDQEEALALSDKIAVMRDGRVVAFDETKRVFEKPRTAFGARFLSRCNVVPGRLHRSGGEVAEVSLLGGRCTVRLPPGLPTDDLSYAVRRDAFAAGTTGDIVVSAVVESLTYRGDAVDLKIRTTTGEVLDVRLPPEVVSTAAVGDPITLSLESSRILPVTGT